MAGFQGFAGCFKKQLKLTLVLFYLFLYVHVSACLFSFLTWNSQDWFPPKDVGRTTAYFNEGDIGTRYVTALYYGTLMLLGADILPFGPTTTAFACAVTLIGAVALAVLFGNMTLLMDSMRLKATRFNEEMDTANQTMATMNIPARLQARVGEYLVQTYSNKDQQRELHRFLSYISPSLKFQLSQFLFSTALLQTHIFKKNEAVVDALVRYVRIDGCNPEAVLVQQGDSGQSMFILAIGEVAVSVQNLEGVTQYVRSLKSGKFFGEVALLTESKRTATVAAVNFCTFGVLSKLHLLDLIGKYPSIKDSLLQHICQEYTDAQRTLVVERLAALPFSLPETDRIMMFYAMQNCFFGKTQVVSPKGVPPEGLLVTVSGQLSIKMKLEKRDWTSTVLNLPPGSLCFCSSFLTQDPLLIEVTASEPTVAYRLEKHMFESNGKIEFLEKDLKGSGTKYVEKVLSRSGFYPDFIRPSLLPQGRESLIKKLKLSVLGMCQSSYGQRRNEMNRRVSTLLELLTNYMNSNKRKTETYDFVEVLQSVITTTAQLKNRVEVLTNEYLQLLNR